MTIIIPIGLNTGSPEESCCIECCKVGCCACGVTGSIDVDVLVWSDVGPSGDLVTSSCASGGGLSFTMDPRIDLCGCVIPYNGAEKIAAIGSPTTPPGFRTPAPGLSSPDVCYSPAVGGATPGLSPPYPSGMCGTSQQQVWECLAGGGILGCRDGGGGTLSKGFIEGNGNYSGSIMDDYPQMWGFSGKVCETCTSCGPEAYDSASRDGACIWMTYCCSTGGAMGAKSISTPTLSWGGWDCYDYSPTCPSGGAGGWPAESGRACTQPRSQVASPCSPCATRVAGQCVPTYCRANMGRAAGMVMNKDQYAVCGYIDCCNPYVYAGHPEPVFDGCPCPWPQYPYDDVASWGGTGCTPAGWDHPNPCTVGTCGVDCYVGGETSSYIERRMGSWPDTCFTFVSVQCADPSINQKFIAVYEATMTDYDCDCQTHMCCDESLVVNYACDPRPSGYFPPGSCYAHGMPGGTGTFTVDCGSYQCAPSGPYGAQDMYGAYLQTIYVKLILTEAD